MADEREILHIDVDSEEAKEQFFNLNEKNRKQFENEEDKLLSIMVYNLAAFMIMMQVRKHDIRRIVRRLIGKCHISIGCCEELNNLLDNLDMLTANDVDLKPLLSNDTKIQSFTVSCAHMVEDITYTMDVCEDCLIIKTKDGKEVDQCPYESIVNMTFSPKNKIICIWRRIGGLTELHKYQSRKSKDLYNCIKGAMEHAAAKARDANLPEMELGGEFPVEDLVTGEGGLLQVCMEGIGVLFADRKIFIRLENIRKCYTQKSGVFVLEEFSKFELRNRERVKQRLMNSSFSLQILTPDVSCLIITDHIWPTRSVTQFSVYFPTLQWDREMAIKVHIFL